MKSIIKFICVYTCLGGHESRKGTVLEAEVSWEGEKETEMTLECTWPEAGEEAQEASVRGGGS